MLIHLTFKFDQESKSDMSLDVGDGRSSNCNCLHLDGIASEVSG